MSEIPQIIKMLHSPELMAEAAAMLELGDVSELTKAMYEMDNRRQPQKTPPHINPLTGRRIWPSIPSRTHANLCSMCGEEMFRCLRTKEQELYKCPNHHHAWVRK